MSVHYGISNNVWSEAEIFSPPSLLLLTVFRIFSTIEILPAERRISEPRCSLVNNSEGFPPELQKSEDMI